MAPLPDAGQDEEPATAEPQQVSADGVTVRKEPDLHGEQAVAIDFTIRSERDDHCLVRLTDALPDAVRDHQVEFHPGFDPSRWRREGDTVVYEAPIGPGVTRRTVYGIVIDDPRQLALFAEPPAVEIADHEPDGSDDALPEPDEPTPDEPFEFDAPGELSPETPEGGMDFTGDESQEASDRSSEAPNGPDQGELVDSLLAALRDGELSSEDRAALREGLGLEPPGSLDDELQTLREEMEALEERLEHEERWRASLRQTMANDQPEE